MAHDVIFDSRENQALLAVCARKTIRTAAIAGIVWGCINLGIGFFAVQTNPLNVGLLALGLLMLGTGLVALRKPSLHALLGEAVVSVLLLCWNLGITILNVRAGDTSHIDGHGLIFPAIAAIIFFRQYKKLGHLKDADRGDGSRCGQRGIWTLQTPFKSKLKQSPDIAEASSKRCRIRLMSDYVFCAQRNLARAFHLSRPDLQQCIPSLDKKRIRVVVRHPLGKLSYAFDQKNSEKIKNWLAAATVQTS